MASPQEIPNAGGKRRTTGALQSAEVPKQNPECYDVQQAYLVEGGNREPNKHNPEKQSPLRKNRVYKAPDATS